jgi:hypothetical protein
VEKLLSNYYIGNFTRFETNCVPEKFVELEDENVKLRQEFRSRIEELEKSRIDTDAEA